MKINALAFSALAVFALAAQAQTDRPASPTGVAVNEASTSVQPPKGSTKTRAEVKAEVKAANADGLSQQGERNVPKHEQVMKSKSKSKSAKSRAEVKAEAAGADSRGLSGEGDRSVPKNQTPQKP